MNVMALRSEPRRVRPSRAAHVEDSQGRARQVPGEDLLGASQLNPSLRTRQPTALRTVLLIMGHHLFGWPGIFHHAGSYGALEIVRSEIARTAVLNGSRVALPR
jgi:hypothetical protein